MLQQRTIDTLEKAFKSIFKETLTIQKTDWSKIASLVQSSSLSSSYHWANRFPVMSEWINERKKTNSMAKPFAIENKKYESHIEVDTADIEDNNIGSYRILIEEMAAAVERNKDKYIFKLLKDGFTNTGYDGVPFFSDNHQITANIDGTGAKIKVSNILNPLVSIKPAWFVLDASRALKPFILQERTNPSFHALTNSDSNYLFEFDRIPFGVRWRGSFGYGAYQSIIACRDALTGANFGKAVNQLLQMKMNGNEYFGFKPTHLIVPPSLRSDAQTIIKKTALTSGDSNPNYNAVDIIVSPWLA